MHDRTVRGATLPLPHAHTSIQNTQTHTNIPGYYQQPQQAAYGAYGAYGAYPPQGYDYYAAYGQQQPAAAAAYPQQAAAPTPAPAQAIPHGAFSFKCVWSIYLTC